MALHGKSVTITLVKEWFEKVLDTLFLVGHHGDMNNTETATHTLLSGKAEVRRSVEGSVWTELVGEISGPYVVFTNVPGLELVLIEGEMIEI